MDDKGMVHGFLEATTALIRANYAPKRTMVFVIVQDEEAGGTFGSRKYPSPPPPPAPLHIWWL